MTAKNEYEDIPGTVVFDAQRARKGYHMNQFLYSLMKAENRKEFLADEHKYLLKFPMTEDQRQAVMKRAWNTMLALGGHVLIGVLIGEGELGQGVGDPAEVQQGVPVPLHHRELLLLGHGPLVEVGPLVRQESFAVLVLHQGVEELVEMEALAGALGVEHPGAGDVLVFLLGSHRKGLCEIGGGLLAYPCR